MKLGIWEILLIVVLALIVFGGTKLAGVGKSLGRGIKEFKEEVHADDEKKETAAEENPVDKAAATTIEAEKESKKEKEEE